MGMGGEGVVVDRDCGEHMSCVDGCILDGIHGCSSVDLLPCFLCFVGT